MKNESIETEIILDDEVGKKPAKATKPAADDVEIDIEDDTPEEDRGRDPMPGDIVDDLENDELEEYSEAVKQRLKQAKKVYHDERRLKEKEVREKNEAVAFAQRMLEENKRLKEQYSKGEDAYYQQSRTLAERDAAMAEREYREAYESGDTDRVAEATNKLTDARYRLQQAQGWVPARSNEGLQPPANPVQVSAQPPQAPQTDPRASAWQERNTWFGTDPEMTSTALGLHQKLLTEKGVGFVQTDEYYETIDNTMRRRFPEYFDGEESDSQGGSKNTPKRTPRSNVVAPASRSSSPKRITLTKSQVELAAKLGLTPEQYARELMKLEAN